jgi:aerobic carbon-monoxide dehydrogenase large subunit
VTAASAPAVDRPAPRAPERPPYIGRSLPRREDRRLIQGQGRYTDDNVVPGALHAAFVRSPYAHADIRRIDVSRALQRPGVVAVLTGADYLADGCGDLDHKAVPVDNLDESRAAFREADGHIVHVVHQPVFAHGRVLHQGEAVAVVIAATAAQARDALEHVDVEYDELPVVTTVEAAMAVTAPQLHAGVFGNVALDALFGNVDATALAFAAAHTVVEGTFHNQRIFSAHLEPRAAIATYDATTDTIDLICGGGGAHRYRGMLAGALHVDESRVHVRQDDVGGSFGSRNSLHPEAVIVAWAARRLQRPVRWLGDRGEGFLTDFEGRDMHARAALAFDERGRILALRTTVNANVGAVTVAYSFLNNYSRIAPGVYDIPAAAIRVRAVLTNTVPVASFRGAGRPEATFTLERLMDMAARRLNLDPAELRRRNLIRREQLPYTAATGLVYDAGDFSGNMEHALKLADWGGMPQRRAESRVRGRLRGIGICNYVEAPVGNLHEHVTIHVLPAGRVEVAIGTQSSGQGHETTFAQIVADLLDVSIETVDMITGDTRRVPRGGGTHSNRSMRLGSTIIARACADIRERARAAAGSDEYDLFELAARVDLQASASVSKRIPAYPTGSAVCEVEIDPATGAVTPLRYTQIDDAGQVINPLLVHGQTQGGIAQGLGQAFSEEMVFDPGTGQVLSGSFMGYAVPHAHDMPPMAIELVEDPTAGNALRIKGGGEAGVTAAPAAAVNAVIDALGLAGVDHIDTPLTAPKLWNILHAHGLTTLPNGSPSS